MKDFIFITGNQHKVEYLEKWLGKPVRHQKIDLDEIQSLDPRTVVEHKARTAYERCSEPVLVEDVGLRFHALGALPGTLIKWFLEELGTDGLCKIMQPFANKHATAFITYGLFDGTDLRFFEGAVEGSVADTPRSLEELEWKHSLSWNSVFIPDGATKTYAEMTDEELEIYSHRKIAIEKLQEFLTS